MADAQDPLIGTVLDDRFEITAVLGQGGMGTVYEAQQQPVGRRVALKTIRADLDSPTVEARFVQEATIIAGLSHPNIVQLYDYGVSKERGLLFLAMEYLDGIPLSSLVRRGALRLPLALTIVRQISSALAEAHSQGVVHRDLKPENVMLLSTAEGAVRIKVLDFGIALSVANETRMTATGSITGTPHYMSPEQAQDAEVDARSDLYALGVIFYELLSGRLPFNADTPLALLLKHVQQPPPDLADAGVDVPDEVAALVWRLLAKEKSERPQTAKELGWEVDRLQRELGLPVAAVDADRPFRDALQAWVLDPAIMGDDDLFGATMESPAAGTATGLKSEPVLLETAAVGGGRQKDKTPLLIGMFIILAVGIAAVALWEGDPASELSSPPVVSPSGENPSGVVAAVPPSDAQIRALMRVGDAHLRAEEATRSREVRGDDERKGKVRPVQPNVDTQPSSPASATPPAPEESQSNKQVPAKSEPYKVRTTPRFNPPPTDDATLAMRKRVAGGTCSARETCVFDTTEPPGHVACLGESSCKADCKLGGCQQYCFDKSTCEFKCTGGGCKRMVGPEATMTELD